MNIDLLAFGAHPDDVEIGAGGVMALHRGLGFAVGICDLTEGEMSSNGTVLTRRQESRAAAEQLGVAVRTNLQLQDRNLRLTQEAIEKVVVSIRTYRPRIVLAPYPDDRHPDHGWCARIVREAIFSSGLKHYLAKDLVPYRPHSFYYYFINDTHPISLCVDVSSVYEQKRKALRCYETQFYGTNGNATTPLNTGSFLTAIEGRDAMFGAQIGVPYAEGLVAAQTIGVSSLFALEREGEAER